MCGVSWLLNLKTSKHLLRQPFTIIFKLVEGENMICGNSFDVHIVSERGIWLVCNSLYMIFTAGDSHRSILSLNNYADLTRHNRRLRPQIL